MSGFLELFSQYDVLGAFLVNIELTLWSALFSLILGVILVVMRISPISSLRAVAGAYVELFKNLPLTIIMVFMVLGAYAQLKLSFSDTFATNFFWLAVTGLSLYTAAFVCESLRSGINTVPIGQAEAARALGLGFMQSATEIILPQAFRGSVAPLGNTLIALLKNSTVAAAASVATARNLPAWLCWADRSMVEPAAWRILPLRLSSNTSPPQPYWVTSLKAMARPATSIKASSVKTTSPRALRLTLPLGNTTAAATRMLSPCRDSSAPWPLAVPRGPADAPISIAPPALITFTEPASPVINGVRMVRLPPLY